MLLNSLLMPIVVSLTVAPDSVPLYDNLGDHHAP
jgi:hypothetical protein